MRKILLFSLLLALAAPCFSAQSAAADDSGVLRDKTLVVWAAPSTLEQGGGSALTIDMANPDAFDAIVFGELTPQVWMVGSSGYTRTDKNQETWRRESEADGAFVRLVVVYRDKTVEFWRDDALTTSYEIASPQEFDESATLLFGPRHMQDQKDVFVGRIRDARIYPIALTREQIAALKPGAPLVGVEPWTWFDFATSGLLDKAGRFNSVSFEGDVKIEDGALVLGAGEGKVYLRSDRVEDAGVDVPKQWSKSSRVPAEVLRSSRLLREKFLDDPYRPRWHFVDPEDNGIPGDPNGCFYANGRYHLMYLYDRSGSSFCWGHVSSVDLIHWRHCPDAIGVGDGDSGCFSGGAFLDDDGTAYLTYWELGALGIGAAKSESPYDRWTKFENNPIIPSTEFGITEIETPEGWLRYGTADPSNIWKKDGKYYVLTGNLCLLNKYGRAEDAPDDMKGDRLYLFESTDLKDWNYKGVFYQRRNEWTDAGEDNMCPSFLPLPSSPDGGEPSGKYLLLFISHNKGCQYYVGEYDKINDRFIPENHGRMTWIDNTYFAPEALVDGKGRQIMWAWLLDNRNDEIADGWSGVYGLPRTLWLGEDGTLRMKPVPELEALRINEKTFENVKVAPNAKSALEGFPGDSFELEIALTPEELAKVERFGVVVREDAGNGEKTTLYYDATSRQLVFDSRESGRQGRPALESAPLELSADEGLTLRVFVDRSVVEVYANDKQAICRRVYPTYPEKAQDVALWNDGDATINVGSVRAWETAASNPY